jgi:hypothetical protein
MQPASCTFMTAENSHRWQAGVVSKPDIHERSTWVEVRKCVVEAAEGEAGVGEYAKTYVDILSI